MLRTRGGKFVRLFSENACALEVAAAGERRRVEVDETTGPFFRHPEREVELLAGERSRCLESQVPLSPCFQRRKAG